MPRLLFLNGRRRLRLAETKRLLRRRLLPLLWHEGLLSEWRLSSKRLARLTWLAGLARLKGLSRLTG